MQVDTCSSQQLIKVQGTWFIHISGIYTFQLILRAHQGPESPVFFLCFKIRTRNNCPAQSKLCLLIISKNYMVFLFPPLSSHVFTNQQGSASSFHAPWTQQHSWYQVHSGNQKSLALLKQWVFLGKVLCLEAASNQKERKLKVKGLKHLWPTDMNLGLPTNSVELFHYFQVDMG